MTATMVARCDGFAAYGSPREARRALRWRPARTVMTPVLCAECGRVHVRRADP